MGQEVIAIIQFFLIRKYFVVVSCNDYLGGMLGEQEKRLVNIIISHRQVTYKLFECILNNPNEFTTTENLQKCSLLLF